MHRTEKDEEMIEQPNKCSIKRLYLPYFPPKIVVLKLATRSRLAEQRKKLLSQVDTEECSRLKRPRSAWLE